MSVQELQLLTVVEVHWNTAFALNDGTVVIILFRISNPCTYIEK